MLLTALLLAAAAAPANYADDANWLCRPGREDACAVNIDATVVEADGSTRVERFARAKSPAVDCFYVYPTISPDPTPNSDLIADAERGVVASQFARFGSVCRTFAPLYRQVTLSALRAAMMGQPMTADPALGYEDVRAAFRHYLATDNKGRPFALIGHSQGARMLEQLVRDEIDGKPVQARMLSVMAIGFNLTVPKGKDAGGSFQSVPLCRSASQTGCAIAYVSFRADAPPPEKSRFGQAADAAMQVACTNPAALGGGKAALDAYLGAKGAGLSSSAAGPWTSDGKAVATAFVKVPGLLSGECVADATGSYLAVTTNADPADPRTDSIVGDVAFNGAVLRDWGLHLVDISAAQGDLIGLVRSQAGAMAGKK